MNNNFVDDESSDEEKDGSEGEIDLQDKDEINDDDIDNIGYDSEENEVDLNDIGNIILLEFYNNIIQGVS